jgi:hypothetical protein
MNRAVGVNPLVTLLSLIAFGSLFGIAGAVVAIPLAAILQLLINRHLLDLQIDETPQASGQRDFTSLLRYRTKELMEDLRRLFRRNPEALSGRSGRSRRLAGSDCPRPGQFFGRRQPVKTASRRSGLG